MKLALLLLLASTTAAAGTRGTVETATSRWSGDLIVTDLVVRAADGSRVTLTEQGGSVDGVGMVVSHRDASMHAGDAVMLDHGRAVRLGSTARARSSTAHATSDEGAGVQRTAASGKPLYHANGCLSFEYDTAGTSKLSGEWAAFDAAFSAWEDASASTACGGVTFSTTLVDNAPEGRDGINTIHFRDTSWCRPASGAEEETCYDPNAIAVTRVLYVDEPWSDRDGEILEVDIDVNAATVVLATDGRANAFDLQSAATHEIGHALGLDHNCGVEDGAWPAYRDGTPVPSCESASPDLVAATMYVSVSLGATSMRSPEVSDTENVCEVVSGTCLQDVSGGCSAGGASGGAVGLLVVGFLGLVGRRRRR